MRYILHYCNTTRNNRGFKHMATFISTRIWIQFNVMCNNDFRCWLRILGCGDEISKMKTEEFEFWSMKNLITTTITATIITCAWFPIFYFLATTLPYSKIVNFFIMLPFLGLCIATLLMVKWILWELLYGKWRLVK